MIALLVFSQAAAWAAGYEEALAAARPADRLVVLHFRSAERPLARRMDEAVLPAAQEVLAGFVNVRLDARAHAALYEQVVGGRGALATGVVDAAGEVVAVLAGYAEAEALADFLRRARAGRPGLRAAREAAARAPGDAGAQLALAEAYLGLGCSRRAQEAYERAAAAGDDTQRAAAHERLARLWVLRGRNVEARGHLARLRALAPSHAPDRALLTEALACSVERKPAEARRLLAEARARFPDSEEADQMMLAEGSVLHEAGDDAGAIARLEELRRRFPRSPWAAEARAQVDHIRSGADAHAH